MKKLSTSITAKIVAHTFLFVFLTGTLAASFLLLNLIQNSTVYAFNRSISNEYDVDLYSDALYQDIGNLQLLFELERGSAAPEIRPQSMRLEELSEEGSYEKTRDSLGDAYSFEQSRKTSFRYVAVSDSSQLVRMSNFSTEQIVTYRNNYPALLQEECMNTLTVRDETAGCTIYAGTAKTLATGDRYDKVHQEYRMEQFILKTGLPILILSFPLALLLLLFIMFATGRKKTDEKIHLSRLDQLPLEVEILLFAMIFIAVFVLAVALAQLNNYSSLDIYSNLIAAAAVYIALYLSGMILFTSVVKRIKAGTIVKNTLIGRMLGWFGRNLHYLAKNIKTGQKVFWLSALFFAVLDFLILLALDGAGKFPVFLLLLCQLLATICLTVFGIQFRKITVGAEKIFEGDLDYRIDQRHMMKEIRTLGSAINRVGDAIQGALDERMKSEMLKTELITNVSHDIKTPLTSIINYVDLLKKESISDPKQQEYLAILDRKSQRLKTLIEDLVEASKASTGNLQIQLERLNFNELVCQATGEYEGKFRDRTLVPSLHLPDQPVYILADGRYIWRVLENLLSNALKYSLDGSRVYVDLSVSGNRARFMIRNISSEPLNFSADELMERFMRGDRSRNTEGSGLGLSITKSLTELQGGEFSLEVDGDLFKAIATFAVCEKPEPILAELPPVQGEPLQP